MTKPWRGGEVLFKQIAENLLTIARRRTLHFSVVQVLQQALKFKLVCSHSTSCVSSAQTRTSGDLPVPPAPADSKGDPREPGTQSSWAELTGTHRKTLLQPQSSSGTHTLLQSFSSHCHLEQKHKNPTEEILIQPPAPRNTEPLPLLHHGCSGWSEIISIWHPLDTQAELPAAHPGHP